MTESIKKRSDGLDFFKFIACLLVVFIHCQFPGETGKVMRTIGRMSVPFFLMVSGYFSVNSDLRINVQKLRKKTLHILYIGLYGVTVYLVFKVSAGVIKGQNIIQVLTDFIFSINIKRFFVENVPPLVTPLWFVFALLYCYLLLFIPFIRKVLINKTTLILAIVLSLGMFISASEIHPFGDIECNIFGIGIQFFFLFRAFPFFLIGLYVRLYKPLCNMSLCYISIFSFFAILISIAERYITSGESQAYIGSIIAATGWLIYGLRTTTKFPIIMVYMGRELSLYIYIYHLLCYHFLVKISPSQWLTPILVVLLSVIMGQITVVAKNKLQIISCYAKNKIL